MTMRIGMIGLDTSHVIEFTKIFQNPRGVDDLEKIEIVAGFPGGSDGLAISRDRVDGFSRQLVEMGVELVDDIAALLDRVDGVMLESVDGNVHLSQAQPVLESGKPLFIDKPLAGTVREAIEIRRLAAHGDVACFSSSCMRFSPPLQDLKHQLASDGIAGAATWGPCHRQPNTADLFFYGIHGIEALFALMGRGCRRVQRTHEQEVDLVVGLWDDGRVGTYRGLRGGASAFGANVFGKESISTIELGIPYRELCIAIAEFFLTGVAPVALDETIEILAFMEAAEESKRLGGQPVRVNY